MSYYRLSVGAAVANHTATWYDAGMVTRRAFSTGMGLHLTCGAMFGSTKAGLRRRYRPSCSSRRRSGSSSRRRGRRGSSFAWALCTWTAIFTPPRSTLWCVSGSLYYVSICGVRARARACCVCAFYCIALCWTLSFRTCCGLCTCVLYPNERFPLHSDDPMHAGDTLAAVLQGHGDSVR